MNINIRSIKLEDAEAIHEIRTMDGVRENIMSLTSDRITKTQAFISGLTNNQHIFVAEVEENGGKK